MLGRGRSVEGKAVRCEWGWTVWVPPWDPTFNALNLESQRQRGGLQAIQYGVDYVEAASLIGSDEHCCVVSVASLLARQWQVVHQVKVDARPTRPRQGYPSTTQLLVNGIAARLSQDHSSMTTRQWPLTKGKASHTRHGYSSVASRPRRVVQVKAAHQRQVVQVEVGALSTASPRHGCMSVASLSKSRLIVNGKLSKSKLLVTDLAHPQWLGLGWLRLGVSKI